MNDENVTEPKQEFFSKNNHSRVPDEKIESLKRVTHVVYLCQALSFFFGVTAIIGIVINYIKRDEVKGTWLESHFTWQINTFWLVLVFYLVSALLLFVAVGFIMFPIVYIWNVYRVVKGWLLLNDGKPMELYKQCPTCVRCKID